MTPATLFSDRGVRTLCKFALIVLAVLAVVWVAVLAALRFVIVPNIEGFRPKLTEFLQVSIGRKVEIGGLAAGWEGWNPRFVLHELKLLDPSGNVALRLPKVEQVVSWNSLLSMQLRSRSLTIDGLRVVVRRNANNQISVAGVEFAQKDPNAPSDPRVADWLLSQRSVSLRDAEVVWIDDMRKAPPIALQTLNARLVNTGNRHRLGVTASWSDDIATPVQFVADMNGSSAASLDDWNGRTYMRLDAVDIAKMKQWVTLPFPVQSGVGGVQVWATLDRGLPNDITADVRLANVRGQLDGAKAPLSLAALQGRMQWSEARGRNILTNARAENLLLTFPDKTTLGPLSFKGLLRRNQQGAFEKSELLLNGIDLADVSKLIPSLPIPDTFSSTLNALALKGKIGATQYQWEGDPKQPRVFNFESSFEKLSLAHVAPYPGVSNVSGIVSVNQAGGKLSLAGDGVVVDMPEVFPISPKFDNLQTSAQWTHANGNIALTLGQTRLVNADVNATIAGAWSRKAGETGPGVADFSGVIERAKAERIFAYLPSVIEPGVRNYVRDAIQVGKVSRGDFILRGPLAKFPFPNDIDGQWKVTARADDVTMDYADNWPKATDADVAFTLSGSRLAFDVQNAKISGIPVKNLRASIPDVRVAQPQLSVIGAASGTTKEFLAFIDNSPVGGWIDQFTRGMQADGDGALSLAFELPLGVGNARAAVKGDYEFRGNTLALGGEIPPIVDVLGKLTFTDRGLSSQGLQGKVLGGPASFVVQNVTGGVKVVANGRVDMAAVAANYPVAQIERLSGNTDWSMELDTTTGGAFVVRSSMRGVQIDAPAPVGKAADDTMPLTITRTPLGQRRDDLTVDLGTTLRSRLRLAPAREGQQRIVEAIAISVGASAKPLEVPTAQQLTLSIIQPEILLDPWLDAFTSTKPATAARASDGKAPAVSAELNPSSVFLEGDRIVARGVTLNKATVIAKPVGQRWQFDVKSREAEGDFVWSPTDSGAGTVQARLSRLVIADKSAGIVAPLTHPSGVAPQVAPSGRTSAHWPALDVAADTFVLRGNQMGRLELKAAPLGEHWRIESLVVSNPDAELRADGVWTRGEPEPQTILTANLKIADTQRYFARLGLGEGIREAKGTIAGKLGWMGSPLDFEMKGLNGEFTLDLGQGRFTKAEPGIAKLLGVISLQSLARRLVFDMRDIFSDGFSFDKATAVVAMRNGILTTEDLDITGPTARVEIRGTVSLPGETQDLNVRVVPDITTSMAIGAGVVTANPLVAAGALIASKVLKDPLDRVLSMKMRVSGTWTDPKVDRVERGGGRPEDEPATRPAGGAG